MASNYSSILVDCISQQLRYLAPIHQFQTWGPNQNPNIPFSTMMSSTNASTVMTINGTNIGIGTSNPNALLHIYSKNSVPSAFIIDGGYSSQFGASLSIVNIPAGQTTATGSLMLGNIGQSYYPIGNANDSFIYSQFGKLIFTTNLTATSLIIDTNGNVGIGTSVASPNNFAVNGTAVFGTYASTSTQLSINTQVAIGGNLGIGTTNATYPLHVQGNAFIGQTLYTSNLTVLGSVEIVKAFVTESSNLVIANVSGVGPALSVTQKIINGNGIIADFYDPDLSTTIPAVRIAHGGNVGLGTGTPTTSLHIYGQSTSIQSAITIDNIPETAGGNPQQYITFRNTTAGTASDTFGLGCIYTNAKAFMISAGTGGAAPSIANAKLTILQNGNTGIGSTQPGYLLDVAGTTRSTNFIGSGTGLSNIPIGVIVGTLANTAASYSILPTVLTAGTYGGAGVIPSITVNAQGVITGISTSTNIAQWSVSGSTASYNGYVGINTNSVPSYALDVIGQTRIQNSTSQGVIIKNTLGTNNSTEVAFDSTIINTNCVASIGIGTDTGGSIRGAYWNVNNADRINIIASGANAGFVGIGSVSPTAKLDVAGTGNYQNTLTVNASLSSTNHLYLNNPSNTATNNASSLIRVAGTTAGNPYSAWDIVGAANGGWSIGVSNSSPYNLVIKNSNSFAIGSASLFTFSSGGVLTATSFSGSGAGLSAGTIPTTALSGTISQGQLPVVGTTQTNIGSSTAIPIISIDTYGRVTALSSTSVSGAWSTASSIYYTINNVGIGTNNPSQLLNIYKQSGTAAAAIVIENTPEATSGADPVQFIKFRANTGGTIGATFGLGCVFNGAVSGDNNKLFITSSSTDTNPTIATAKLTLTQSGNIGIGTTIPNAQFNVYGNSGNPISINVTNIYTSAYAIFSLTSDASSAYIQKYGSAVTTNTGSGVYPSGLNINNNSGPIVLYATTNPIYNICSLYNISTTSLTNAFQVYANGVVNIGNNQTNVNKILTIYDGSTADTPASATNFYGFGYNNTPVATLRYQAPASGAHTWYTSTTGTMQLSSSGTLTVLGDIIAFGSISDKQFKENVADLPSTLDNIMKLRPVSFDWKKDIFNKEKAGSSDIGLIAQEVAKVYPDIVEDFRIISDAQDATIYKRVKYEKLIIYLLKGMQEMQEDIKMLKEAANSN
jgi:hypothetical protein